MKVVVGAVLVLTALGGGVAGATSPSDDAPGAAKDSSTLTEAEIYGSGLSGSGSEIADCGPLTYVAEDWSCQPTSTPSPPGTTVLSVAAGCPVAGDLEGAFSSSDQMDTLIECILPVAVDWLTWEFSGLIPPPEWTATSSSLLPNNFVFVPAGVSGDSAQDCGYDEYMLAYCPRDGNIYFGESQLWSDYNGHGDADIWGTISHEMGHRVQHVAGMHAPLTANETIPTENQADCFSGAFMGYAARHRYMDPAGLDTVSDDDVADMIVGLLDIGESEGPERTHGTDDQRIRALYIGYNSPADLGVFVCDFYLSDISIVPASAG